MDLREYLEQSNDEFPSDGDMGVESDWLLVDHVTVQSGQVWVGDPQFAWAEANEGEGCLVDVFPGQYSVEARGVDYNGARFVSRIRIRKQDAGEVSRGEEVGEAGTDSGQVGVADQKLLMAAFQAACGDDVDAALDLLEAQINQPVGVVQPDSDAIGKVVYLPSGTGDGGGPVWELVSNGERVGLEHAFIDVSEPW